MPRFRKSNPSAGAPPPGPESPADLVPTLVSQRDSTAIAATSSAIALSITSAFVNTLDMSSDGSADRDKDSGWRTAYAAVRMAVEVTKESSDMFLPLKAVVGAVSALMKNCDVSRPHLRTEWVPINISCSSKQQIMQQISRIWSGGRSYCMACFPLLWVRVIMQRKQEEWSFECLYSCTYTFFTDPFHRKLDRVIEKLEPLSEQHVLLKFLQNVDNAKTLSGFVQELADAIMYYQV